MMCPTLGIKLIFFGPLDFGFLSKETLRFWGPKKDQDTAEKNKKTGRDPQKIQGEGRKGTPRKEKEYSRSNRNETPTQEPRFYGKRGNGNSFCF